MSRLADLSLLMEPDRWDNPYEEDPRLEVFMDRVALEEQWQRSNSFDCEPEEE